MTMFAAQAFSAATPYILINKEFRHIDQEDSANQRTTTGITDVDGFETRLGVKGHHKAEDGTTVHGKVELGINSKRDGQTGSAGERIRIRLAQVDLGYKFGTFTIGKHWNPNTKRMLALDPLTGTGAQLLGLESGDVVGATSGAFGMKARYFNDGLTFTTNDMNGFAFSLTHDKSDDDLNKDDDGVTEEWTTAVVTYDRNYGDSIVAAHLTYATGSIEGDTNLGDQNQAFITLGLKYTKSKWGFSAAYTQEDRGDLVFNSAAKAAERTHMLAAFWYSLNAKNKIALNYGNTDFDVEQIGNVTTADDKGGSQTQYALGWIHQCNKHTKLRLIYRVQEIKSDGTALVAGTSTDNKANTIIAGVTVSI